MKAYIERGRCKCAAAVPVQYRCCDGALVLWWQKAIQWTLLLTMLEVGAPTLRSSVLVD